MVLGLFGYYHRHFGSCRLLRLRSRDLNLPWDLVTSTVILSGFLGVYPQEIGLSVSLFAGVVLQNLPSHFTQHMPIEVPNLSKDDQELTKQILLLRK